MMKTSKIAACLTLMVIFAVLNSTIAGAATSQPASAPSSFAAAPITQLVGDQAKLKTPPDQSNAQPDRGEAFFKFYSANMRASLFSGFLTLTGFLFSIKTFIVVNIKKEVYDTTTYQERYKTFRQLNPSLSFYGPLRRFSRLLLVCICSSLLASVSQLTLGLVASPYTAGICLFLAAMAIALLVATLIIVGRVLSKWFEFIEEERQKPTSVGPAVMPPAGPLDAEDPT